MRERLLKILVERGLTPIHASAALREVSLELRAAAERMPLEMGDCAGWVKETANELDYQDFIQT
jgi:hypothetical protein